MALEKSGSSKLIIACGSFVAVALIFGVLYKTGNLSQQDEFELMGVIPEQIIIENAATESETPTAEIPQTQNQTESVANKVDDPDQIKPLEVTEATKTEVKSVTPSLPILDASDSLVRETLLNNKSSKGLSEWLKFDDLIQCRRCGCLF